MTYVVLTMQAAFVMTRVVLTMHAASTVAHDSHKHWLTSAAVASPPSALATPLQRAANPAVHPACNASNTVESEMCGLISQTSAL